MYLYCHVYGVCISYRPVLDWMIGFIDTIYTELGTTGDYSAIVISTLSVHRYARIRVLSLH
jgi:hypothetical protein